MNRNGTATDSQMFKIRRISNGLYFTPGYRTVTWDEKGKVYATLQAAKSAALHCSVDNGCEKVRLAPNKVEIVQFGLAVVAVHRPWA